MEAQVLKFKRKADLYDGEYNEVISMASELLNLSEEDTEKMRNNMISQIIVKLPFLARCDNPQRTALSHIVITYAASHYSCKKAFLHNLTDNEDLFHRLECINNFSGGDSKVIKSGMNLLAILMLSDHQKDRGKDLMQKKYNPLNTGTWNYDMIVSQLQEEIHELDCPEMAYLPGEDDVRQGFWEYP
ncbi:MAG: hypothetical protein PQJ60_01855 [Spirochaetales bacterium]|nr:hypothetical protein [Spirochaetales bacterium]